MEIVIGLVVVVALGLLWQANRKKSTEAAEAAPYKVETQVVGAYDTTAVVPVAIGDVPVMTAVVEGAGLVEVPVAAPVPAEKPAKAKKAPAKKAPAKKPVATKTAKAPAKTTATKAPAKTRKPKA